MSKKLVHWSDVFGRGVVMVQSTSDHGFVRLLLGSCHGTVYV